jgi:ABC-type lipoprotein export system ATPase subunit
VSDMTDPLAVETAAIDPAAVETAAIEIEGLVRSFEHGAVRALDGVDLTVRRGEMLAVTGSSGSGKSTLLHLIAALDTPSAGSLRVLGNDIGARRDLDRYRRLELGLVFQLHNLLPHLSAVENVEVPMFGTGLRRKGRRERALELLADVQLAGRERRVPPKLSGGERQRVAIARALANQPTLLLADEPTGNLDSASATHVLDVLQRLRTQREITIVMVTHDPVVAAAADRVVHMQDGRLTTAASAHAT